MTAEAIVSGRGVSDGLAAGGVAVVQSGRECGQHKQQQRQCVHNWFKNSLV
jgi:hypothetical protein